MTSIASPDGREQVEPLMATIYARRSIRRYTDERVPREVVTALLDAAIRAPSAHNRQPWRFAVIEDDAMKRTLAAGMGERLRADLARDGVPQEVIDADAGRSYARLTGAPVLIVLCLTMRDMDAYPDPVRAAHERTMAVQSVAMAGQNLLLSAHAHGLGACWMCAPLFCEDVVRAALELDADWEPQAIITIGVPAESRSRARNPLEESVVWR